MIPFRLGLTGSIGMGKSATAGFLRAQGLPVWDADAAVHRLYAPGGAAVAPIAALCPEAVTEAGVSRETLKTALQRDPALLPALESLVHPLVAADRAAFLAQCTADIAVFDIPLLFEKGSEAEMNATLLVTATPALQRARVLARPGMTEAQFALILSRQMPDRDKRARATHIIETLGLAAVEAAVQALIAYLKESRDA